VCDKFAAKGETELTEREQRTPDLLQAHAQENQTIPGCA